MSIKKCVIAAAGLGTRLLPASKELPKEMFPMFTVNRYGKLAVKPLLQIIFERFYGAGVREFCFVVGRGKRAIEDHFTPDWKFVDELNAKNRSEKADELESFYRLIEDSVIIWVNQPKPLGFGHAVYSAKSFVGNDDFFVVAGDTYVVSKDRDLVSCLVNTFYKTNSSATLFLKRVTNPKIYGVVKIKDVSGYVKIRGVIEKPTKPHSNIAITPYYIFKQSVMEALSKVKLRVGEEIQLTDAIQTLIKQEEQVTGVLLRDNEFWFDIGTPETYSEALENSKTFETIGQTVY